MSYIVVKAFVDLKDKSHRYEVGDEYPRLGLTVSTERLKELSTTKNRRGVALIKTVVETDMAAEHVKMVVETSEKDSTKKNTSAIDKPVKKGSAPRRGRKKNVE